MWARSSVRIEHRAFRFGLGETRGSRVQFPSGPPSTVLRSSNFIKSSSARYSQCLDLGLLSKGILVKLFMIYFSATLFSLATSCRRFMISKNRYKVPCFANCSTFSVVGCSPTLSPNFSTTSFRKRSFWLISGRHYGSSLLS